jgi:hypothetical protein
LNKLKKIEIAYLSLNPQSKLYKLRLSRYDIKQII